MQNPCQDAHTLIPSYLDGELSEEQAAPLRRHLLECQPCRDLAQDQQALKRWFTADEALVAPPGFAARVARRAFAGDAGVLPDYELDPQLQSSGPKEERVLQFVLQLTAVAAAVLFCLALAIRGQSLPTTEDLGATEDYSEVLKHLEELNRAEAVEPASTTRSALEASKVRGVELSVPTERRR
jgi:anti-sigma factor RsiW